MCPQNTVRRQRVGVKAFITVDGRVGKSGQRRAVFQQAADVVIPGIAQQVFIAGKRIDLRIPCSAMTGAGANRSNKHWAAQASP